MRVLVVGAGGVGAAVAAVASRRDFFERMIFADVDEGRARAAVEREGDARFAAASVMPRTRPRSPRWRARRAPTRS